MCVRTKSISLVSEFNVVCLLRIVSAMEIVVRNECNAYRLLGGEEQVQRVVRVRLLFEKPLVITNGFWRRWQRILTIAHCPQTAQRRD
ncbi:unnamed protein product [Trichogramma brassicae]|uniref:Secreted protein n=1 Tax=Trichogramma brassicae TaxID=86971 RepID=A0A6H5HUB4_9HYME|nr:unnamed protein product [Trichogramma brassicae]